jgi:hypothetical protein
MRASTPTRGRSRERPVAEAQGFRGIGDSLGRDELELDFASLDSQARLVAIAGANGHGKATVRDNLHPLC